jgi:hypothetical protein
LIEIVGLAGIPLVRIAAELTVGDAPDAARGDRLWFGSGTDRQEMGAEPYFRLRSIARASPILRRSER